MLRNCRLVVAHARQAFLQELTWRAFLISIVLQHLVTPLLGLAVWTTALPGQPAIVRYYIAILAVQMVTVSYEHHTLSNAIYNGDFTNQLAKPQPAAISTVGMTLSMKAWHVMFAVPISALLAVALGAWFPATALLLALPAIVLAAWIRFLFTYVLALSAFWSQQAMGLVGLGETVTFLLGGVAAPLTLFPSGTRTLVELLPFSAMLGFPAETASGVITGSQVLAGFGLQVAWVVVLTLAAMKVWRAGLHRYSALGG